MPFPRSKKIHDEESLYTYAVEALGRRMRTVAELKRLLRQKNVVGDREKVIDAIINRLKDQRYLNDTQFATLYSTYRKDSQGFGKQRVITDLKVKGVHGDVIEKTVGSVYEGVDEEQLARDFLRRKRIQPPSKAPRGRFSESLAALKQSQKETARIFRTLVRAGFRTETIVRVLKNWDVEDGTLTALQEEPLEAEPRRRGDAEEY